MDGSVRVSLRRWGIERNGVCNAQICVGDMDGQIRQTVRRLEETMTHAGFALSDVVQIRIFTTDIDDMKANYNTLLQLLADAGCRPASLLAEVNRLSDPDMLLEIEAVAAQ
jgi:enamine deaminase RidA (YjgF/YER057c/UK114 family)